MLTDNKIFQNAVSNGIIKLVNPADNADLTADLLESDTLYRWIEDTSDDAKAESKYDYETQKLKREEKRLDLELQQMETQHEAILKELESVRKVISNNIDRTFNLFNNG